MLTVSHRSGMGTFLAFAGVVMLCGGCVSSSSSTWNERKTGAARIDPAKIVDLSYSFGPETIYWPTAEPFKLRRVAYGRSVGGYWYVANNLSMAEHGGTHMDAPIHFGEGKMTAAQVPLANCIGAAIVIDVTEQAVQDRDYRLSVADVTNWERQHGAMPRGAIVIMRSGWGRRWPDKKRYLGTDKPMDVANLHFPGFSREAVEFLVRERDVAALGVDTASIDYGQTRDFIAHQVLNAANKPAFENVANVERLPATGATFIALPLRSKTAAAARRGSSRCCRKAPPHQLVHHDAGGDAEVE
jgi:kynurenine formamidase